jgi:hypothetical protein
MAGKDIGKIMAKIEDEEQWNSLIDQSEDTLISK